MILRYRSFLEILILQRELGSAHILAMDSSVNELLSGQASNVRRLLHHGRTLLPIVLFFFLFLDDRGPVRMSILANLPM